MEDKTFRKRLWFCYLVYVSTDEEPHYGMMRKTYLKEHRPAIYSRYMLEDRLIEQRNALDEEAQEEVRHCGRNKSQRPDGMVRAVNNFQNVVEEIVSKELVYI